MAPDPIPPASPFDPRLDPLLPPAASRAPSRGDSRPAVLSSLVDTLRPRQTGAAPREVLLAVVRDALESGKPDAALGLLDELWSADVTREDCWYLRGQALYELERFAEAGEVAGQGLARAPRSAALLFLLSNCELELSNLPGAERAIAGALALLPEHPVLLSRYAELLARAGRLDEAGDLLERAAAAAPGHPLVAHAQVAPSAARSPRSDDVASVIGAGPDPYGRAALGLSLLTPAARLVEEPGTDAACRRTAGLVVTVMVGGAIVLAALGFRPAGATLLVTALAGPRLWRARG